MARIWADKVLETTTTTGTGPLTLAGAVTGYKTFASRMAEADTCQYVITAVDTNGNPTGDWEAGIGTLTSGALVRTTVQSSSNADAAVNFAAGTKHVALTLSAAAIQLIAGGGGLPSPASNPGQMVRSRLDGTGFELVNVPSVGPAVFGSHRYWAFFPTGWQGAPNGPSSYTTIHELTFRGTPGGARILGGTAKVSTTYDGANPATKLYDSSNTSYWGSDTESAGVGYAGYDFGAGNLVSINEVMITVGTDNPGERPTRGFIAYSDNGTTWTMAWEIPAWTYSSPTSLSTVTHTNPRYAANVVPSVGAVGVTTISTNANATLTFGATKQTVLHTGVLTADRTLTLATPAQEGAKFRVTRTGSGAFNLSVGGLKNLAQNTWCDVEWNAATNAWILTASGAL